MKKVYYYTVYAYEREYRKDYMIFNSCVNFYEVNRRIFKKLIESDDNKKTRRVPVQEKVTEKYLWFFKREYIKTTYKTETYDYLTEENIYLHIDNVVEV